MRAETNTPGPSARVRTIAMAGPLQTPAESSTKTQRAGCSATRMALSPSPSTQETSPVLARASSKPSYSMNAPRITHPVCTAWARTSPAAKILQVPSVRSASPPSLCLVGRCISTANSAKSRFGLPARLRLCFDIRGGAFHGRMHRVAPRGRTLWQIKPVLLALYRTRMVRTQKIHA